MKGKSVYLFLAATFICATSEATDLQDVLTHPERYDGRRVDLVGIARVPGEFHLFATAIPAEKLDFSKALLVRQKMSGPDYADLDRQWARVTGTVHSNRLQSGDLVAALDIESAVRLANVPPPRIKDFTVFGVFKNTTSRELRVDLSGASFWVGPGGENRIELHQGPVVAFALKEGNRPPWDRPEDKPVARGEIRFTNLPRDYEYSSAQSSRRTFYYSITTGEVRAESNSK